MLYGESQNFKKDDLKISSKMSRMDINKIAEQNEKSDTI